MADRPNLLSKKEPRAKGTVCGRGTVCGSEREGDILFGDVALHHACHSIHAVTVVWASALSPVACSTQSTETSLTSLRLAVAQSAGTSRLQHSISSRLQHSISRDQSPTAFNQQGPVACNIQSPGTSCGSVRHKTSCSSTAAFHAAYHCTITAAVHHSQQQQCTTMRTLDQYSAFTDNEEII